MDTLLKNCLDHDDSTLVPQLIRKESGCISAANDRNAAALLQTSTMAEGEKARDSTAEEVGQSGGAPFVSSVVTSKSATVVWIPSTSQLHFLEKVVLHRVPTACISRSIGASGEQFCKISVGCAEDFSDIVESAKEFSVDISPIFLAIKCSIPPSNEFILSVPTCAAAMSDASGWLAHSAALLEAKRCVHGANIDCLPSPIVLHTSGSDGPVTIAPSAIYVRVPCWSGAITRARAVVARIRAKLPHALLWIEAVEGEEEDLVYEPLGAAAITFSDVMSPSHPPHFLLKSKAIMGNSSSPSDPASSLRPDTIELEDEEERSAPIWVARGHITVGAYSNDGATAIATAHGLPNRLDHCFLRGASTEYGVGVKLVALMNPAQFDGSGAMAFVNRRDADPGATGPRNDNAT